MSTQKRKSGDEDAQLGARIREIRKLRRLSLTQLGDMSGVSASFLSQLERGACGASFGTLRDITEALGTTLAELFNSDQPPGPRIVRHADRPQLIHGGARKYMLSPRPLSHIEMFAGEFDPGESTGDEPYNHGDSQEFLTVIRGSVDVQIDGRSHLLDAGDTIEYRSSQMHRTVNVGDGVAEVHWIVSPVTVPSTTGASEGTTDDEHA
ncbi:helix-turn-helix domain-containing protein [Leucobacter sp. BZR 635]|uniref:helix-turn-helix domain-containing protein n=1 Tax=Leucobacter sp. G161 TaxID=663704 RepID=UPI0009F846B7|nr:XRE family transcriptional regulator [Leucobacter sp. G161]